MLPDESDTDSFSSGSETGEQNMNKSKPPETSAQPEEIIPGLCINNMFFYELILITIKITRYKLVTVLIQIIQLC